MNLANIFLMMIKSLLQKIHQDSTALYADKTYERLEAYAKQKSIDLDKPARYNGKKFAISTPNCAGVY